MDLRMVRRLVGFHEYGHALDHLDRLASMSDKEDFDAINEILDDHREFDLFVKLPDGFRNVVSVSGVEELQDSRRSGLEWIIALARVEFGAMVSGFTSHPDPYQTVQPESFAYDATMQLLLEGVAGHYLALQDADKLHAQLMKIHDDDQVRTALAKSRRVRIARMMLQALEKIDPASYSDQQAGQLAEVQQDLNRQQVALRRVISAWLMTQTSTERTVSSTSFEHEFVNACGIQLEAERRELASGTATVTNFPLERQ